MTAAHSQVNLPETTSESGSPSLAFLLMGFALGATIGSLVLLLMAPTVLAAVAHEQAKLYWFLSRSAGIVSYVLLTSVTGTGILLSTKYARRWPGTQLALELHRFLSLLALLLVSIHVFALLGDRWANYTLAQLITPFAAMQYRPFWVGIGQVAFYMFVILFGSFWLRRWIGSQTWRRLHYFSYACWLLATLHGIMTGSDLSVLVPLYEIAAGLVTLGALLRLVEFFLRRVRNMTAYQMSVEREA